MEEEQVENIEMPIESCNNCVYLGRRNMCRRYPPPFKQVGGTDWCGAHSSTQARLEDMLISNMTKSIEEVLKDLSSSKTEKKRKK